MCNIPVTEVVLLRKSGKNQVLFFKILKLYCNIVVLTPRIF
jgi:hypothetical protein